MNKMFISSELLKKEDKIINLFSVKPLNFNGNQISEEEAKKSYDILQKQIDYKLKKIIKPIQNHTNIVQMVTEQNINGIFENVDGLITNLKGVALVTSLADCQGILLYDPINNVIGNIHSGWKGTLNTIIENAIQLMISNYKSNPENILVYITPSIGKCCFEVDEDVKDMFLDKFNCINDIYLGNKMDSKQKYYVDTKSINKKLLLNMGIKEKNIDVSSECTMCKSDKYHSYRKEKDNSGRNVAIICLK